MAKPDPQGVIAIVTAPDGSVVATATDFNRSGYGGCELYEAQGLRAEREAKRNAVKAYCSPAVTDALSTHLIEQVFDALRQKGGHRLMCKAVGYGRDAQEYFDHRHGRR